MSLLAALALLGGGALLLALLPPHRNTVARAACLGIIAAAVLLLSRDLTQALAGNTVSYLPGAIVPSLPVVARLDTVGATVFLLAVGAALLTLTRSAAVGSRCALLLGLAATFIACTGSTVTELSVAVGLAVVAHVWEAGSERRRLGRGMQLQLAAGLAATVAVMGVGVLLVATVGTDDITALPPGTVGTGIALPLALAALLLLVGAAGLGAETGGRRHDVAAVAMVPVGVLLLVRLAQGGGGSIDPATAVVLGVVGVALAIGSALRAWRCAGDGGRCAAWLCAGLAAATIALSGLSTDLGRIGFGAAALQLGLATAAAPLWSRLSVAARGGRLALGLCLAQLGGLPVGFGALATGLGVEAALSLGDVVGRLMATGLALAAVVAAIAALRGVFAAVSPPKARDRWRGEGIPIVAVSLAAAVVPGFVMTNAGAALAGVSIPVPDAFTVATAAGGWAGGYLSAALLLGLLLVVAAAHLLQWRLRPVPHTTVEVPLGLWWHLLGPRRRLGAPTRMLHRVLRALDGWLLLQPQLSIAIGACVVAIIVIR